jgi:hypothetical protein
MRRLSVAVDLFCCLVVASALAAEQREVTGTLVQPKTRLPIAGQKLVLDRATGDYSHVPFAMLVVGTPQPGTIETAVTDSRGRFRFVTTKDRGRFLEVRISGTSPADFRSTRGYAVEHLHDSLHPDKPLVDFDTHIMHNPRGGFMSVP